MFTDIVGFTKIMTDSEDIAINILKVQDDIFNPLLKPLIIFMLGFRFKIYR